jgi:hypothetical protein
MDHTIVVYTTFSTHLLPRKITINPTLPTFLSWWMLKSITVTTFLDNEPGIICRFPEWRRKLIWNYTLFHKTPPITFIYSGILTPFPKVSTVDVLL